MKKLRTLSLIIAAFVAFALPASALADAKSSICEGVGITGGTTGCTPPAGSKTTVDTVVAAAIDIFSVVVGVIAVIMIIVGGLKYVMSSGDSNNITSAKNTILYAIIGLVVVAMAQVIVRFVVSKL